MMFVSVIKKILLVIGNDLEKYKMKDSKTNQSQDMFLTGQLQYHIQ